MKAKGGRMGLIGVSVGESLTIREFCRDGKAGPAREVAGARDWRAALAASLPVSPPGAVVVAGAPEAPLVTVPAHPGRSAVPAGVVGGAPAYLVPGLRQERPADALRGPETVAAGFLARHSGFDGVLCLPGAVCAWLHVSAGEVVSFRSFLTGEMIALLRDRSSLAAHVAGDGTDPEAFARAVGDTLARPQNLAAALAGIRGAAGDGGALLIGTLIGAELAAARPFWLGQAVAVIGDGALARSYTQALTLQGCAPLAASGEVMLAAGLAAAYATVAG